MNSFIQHIPTFCWIAGTPFRFARGCYARRKAIGRLAVFVAAVLATLAAIFYTIELHRGRSAWQEYAAQAVKSGSKIDFASFDSPPLPDAENFAAIAYFQPDKKGPHLYNGPAPMLPPPVGVAVDRDVMPRIYGFIDRAEVLPGLIALEKQLRASSEPDLPKELDISPAANLAVLNKIFGPVWAELHGAVSRPACRFSREPQVGVILETPILPLLRMRIAFFWTALQFQLHAEQGDSASALEDLRVMLRMGDAFKTEPGLVSAMARSAFLNMTLDQSLWCGLYRGVWDDAALKEIDHMISGIDFVEGIRFGIESERALTNSYYQEMAAGRFQGMATAEYQEMTASHFTSLGNLLSGPHDKRLITLLELSYPIGWVYQNQLLTNQYFDAVLKTVDVPGHRLDIGGMPLAAIDDLADKGRQNKIRDGLFILLLPPASQSLFRSAYCEANVRQARTAIALERYRMAHGAYPVTLEPLLLENLIPALPLDPVSNIPMEYSLPTLDNYLLKAPMTEQVAKTSVNPASLLGWSPKPKERPPAPRSGILRK